MMKKHIFIYSVWLLLLPVFAGCREEAAWPGGENQIEAKYLDAVGAFYAGSDEDDMPLIPENPKDGEYKSEHDDNYQATVLLNDSLKYGDILYFSQLVSGKMEPFTGVAPEKFPSTMTDSVRDLYKNGYPNVYDYYYKKEYDATWEDVPGGYNFFADTVTNKMDWDIIKIWGLNNSGYALYALYYPYNNQLPKTEEGKLDFRVQTDQTTKENLQKSNFIGAYHSSSSAYSRLKFKLYHLMTYLKVTLYVPVYNPNDTIVVTGKDGKRDTVPGRTGFPADALQSAEVRYVIPNFNINWYAQRSTDTAPATSAATDSARTTIKMYIPGTEDYSATNGLPPVVTINPKDFIRDGYSNMDIPNEDKCWEITLSALIPAGQDYPRGSSEYANGMSWTNLNFLRFNLRENIGEVLKRYIFTGMSETGLIGSGDNINLAQGHLQHLSLYLPRYGAQAVLLNANVIDWEQWYNDNMGLRPDAPLNNEEENTEDL